MSPLPAPAQLLGPPRPPKRAIFVRLTQDVLDEMRTALLQQQASSGATKLPALGIEFNDHKPIMRIGSRTVEMAPTPETASTFEIYQQPRAQPAANGQTQLHLHSRVYSTLRVSQESNAAAAEARVHQRTIEAEKERRQRHAIFLDEAPSNAPGKKKGRSTATTGAQSALAKQAMTNSSRPRPPLPAPVPRPIAEIASPSLSASPSPIPPPPIPTPPPAGTGPPPKRPPTKAAQAKRAAAAAAAVKGKSDKMAQTAAALAAAARGPPARSASPATPLPNTAPSPVPSSASGVSSTTAAYTSTHPPPPISDPPPPKKKKKVASSALDSKPSSSTSASTSGPTPTTRAIPAADPSPIPAPSRSKGTTAPKKRKLMREFIEDSDAEDEVISAVESASTVNERKRKKLPSEEEELAAAATIAPVKSKKRRKIQEGVEDDEIVAAATSAAPTKKKANGTSKITQKFAADVDDELHAIVNDSNPRSNSATVAKAKVAKATTSGVGTPVVKPSAAPSKAKPSASSNTESPSAHSPIPAPSRASSSKAASTSKTTSSISAGPLKKRPVEDRIPSNSSNSARKRTAAYTSSESESSEAPLAATLKPRPKPKAKSRPEPLPLASDSSTAQVRTTNSASTARSSLMSTKGRAPVSPPEPSPIRATSKRAISKEDNISPPPSAGAPSQSRKRAAQPSDSIPIITTTAPPKKKRKQRRHDDDRPIAPLPDINDRAALKEQYKELYPLYVSLYSRIQFEKQRQERLLERVTNGSHPSDGEESSDESEGEDWPKLMARYNLFHVRMSEIRAAWGGDPES